jgi:branched-chain amino acid transport system substrate-binding protein
MPFLSAPARPVLARVLARTAAVGMTAGAAAVLLSTMSVEQGCADKAPSPSVEPPIVIGASLGLTNGLAGTSAPLRDALRVAEGQINAAGGLLGRRVVFDIVDDTSDEDAIVTKVAEDFVRKGVVAVIGPVSSGQVVKVHKIYADAQIIEMSATSTSTELTNIQPTNNRWFFRTTPADDFQGAAVMAFAQKTPRGLGDAGVPQVDGGPPATCSKLAILHIDNSYGNSMSDVIQASWPKKTGQQVLVRKKVAVELAPSYQDVVSEILSVPGGPPQCLAVISYDDVAAQFIRDFKADSRYAALAANGFFFIGTDGVYTDLFLKYGLANQSDPSSANVAEGVTGTNPDTQPGTPEYNQYKTIYSSYFPLGVKDAPSFSANAFDAAMLIALAIQRAGTVADRVAVRNALLEVANPPGKTYSPGQLGDALQALLQGQDIDYKGASGNVDLEPNGNVKAGFIVWEAFKTPAKNYEYRTVGRFQLEELLDQLR